MRLLWAVMAAGSLMYSSAYSEEVKVSGTDVLSIGDHGKILNNTVYACRVPAGSATFRQLHELSAHQIMNGQSPKVSPDGECWPLGAGTEVELVKTESSNDDVVCVRVLNQKSCGWTLKLGIEPVAVYDHEHEEAQKIMRDVNAVFDRQHPECKNFRTNPNLPSHCY